MECETGYEFMSGMLSLVIIAFKNIKMGHHEKFGMKQMNEWLSKMKQKYDN